MDRHLGEPGTVLGMDEHNFTVFVISGLVHSDGLQAWESRGLCDVGNPKISYRMSGSSMGLMTKSTVSLRGREQTLLESDIRT